MSHYTVAPKIHRSTFHYYDIAWPTFFLQKKKENLKMFTSSKSSRVTIPFPSKLFFFLQKKIKNPPFILHSIPTAVINLFTLFLSHYPFPCFYFTENYLNITKKPRAICFITLFYFSSFYFLSLSPSLPGLLLFCWRE